MAAAVARAASPSRPLTTTPAPCCANKEATAAPMPRDPPTTTAPRPASNEFTPRGRMSSCRDSSSRACCDQPGVVDLIGEHPAYLAGDSVVKLAAQHQDMRDLV